MAALSNAASRLFRLSTSLRNAVTSPCRPADSAATVSGGTRGGPWIALTALMAAAVWAAVTLGDLGDWGPVAAFFLAGPAATRHRCENAAQ